MAEKAKKTTAVKTAKKVEKKVEKESKGLAIDTFANAMNTFKDVVKKNPMLSLGMIMDSLQNPSQKPVLVYISELEKKFTPDELVAIATKVMKRVQK